MALQEIVTTPFETVSDEILGGGKTVTLKELVALRGGTSLSETIMWTLLVVFAMAAAGVQVNTPEAESILEPAGAFGPNEKVSESEELSGSVARLVTVSNNPA
jgi:hypothetical protein